MITRRETRTVLTTLTIGKQPQNFPVIPSEKFFQMLSLWAGELPVWQQFFESTSQMHIVRYAGFVEVYLSEHKISC